MAEARGGLRSGLWPESEEDSSSESAAAAAAAAAGPPAAAHRAAQLQKQRTEPPWLHKYGRNLLGPLLARGEWAVGGDRAAGVRGGLGPDSLQAAKEDEEEEDEEGGAVALLEVGLCVLLLSAALLGSSWRLYQHFWVEPTGLDFRASQQHEEL
jgi:hypothetical protein